MADPEVGRSVRTGTCRPTTKTWASSTSSTSRGSAWWQLVRRQVALGLAIELSEWVDRLVLMGSVGVPFELTEGLDRVWGYRPSIESMGRLTRQTFAYDPTFVTDELVRLRFEASARPGAQEAFASMFPAPRQRWVDALAHDEAAVRAITRPTLLVHGRDDLVVPLSATMTLLEWDRRQPSPHLRPLRSLDADREGRRVRRSGGCFRGCGWASGDRRTS